MNPCTLNPGNCSGFLHLIEKGLENPQKLLKVLMTLYTRDLDIEEYGLLESSQSN